MLKDIFDKIARKPDQARLNEELIQAAIDGDLREARKLIDAGADVNCRNDNQLSPLYFAASQGFEELTRLLLERGASPDAGRNADLEGTALSMAAREGHFGVVKLLVEHKADLNTTGYEWRTGLHEAIWTGREAIALYLAEAGAGTATRSRLGDTPLQDAVKSGMRRVALVLCRHGADATVENKDGQDMLVACADKGWTDVVAAVHQYRHDQEERARRAIIEEEERRAALALALENAPVLQQDMVVRRPLMLKSTTP